jgi:Zn-dependent protease with chaperone function
MDVTDAVEALRPLLPAWAGLVPLALWAPAACVIGWSCAALAARVAIGPYRRLDAKSHWVERARHAYPARAAVGLTIWIALGALGVISARLGSGALALLPPLALGLAVGACAYAGGAQVAARLLRELGLGSRRVRDLARDDAVGLLLLAPHVLLPLAFAPAIRAPLDRFDALLQAALALLFVAIACGGALCALRWLGLVQPAPERLLHAVRATAQAQGAREPAVEVVRWGAANAFAIPLARRLAFSSRCLELLDDAELGAVAAHEIAHLDEPLAVRLARSAMLFATLPLAGLFAVADLAGPLGPLGVMCAILLAALLFRALAARMEQRADHAALGGAESSPQYARALERIYAANLMPAVLAGRPVHPHLHDRLVAAGAPPAWPRPEPPSSARFYAAVGVAALWLMASSVLVVALPSLIPPASSARESVSDLLIALEPGSGPLLRRALLEDALGRPERALAFARAATSLEPWSLEAWSLVATGLARAGECGSAAQAFEQASLRSFDGAGAEWLASAGVVLAACRPSS